MLDRLTQFIGNFLRPREKPVSPEASREYQAWADFYNQEAKKNASSQLSFGQNLQQPSPTPTRTPPISFAPNLQVQSNNPGPQTIQRPTNTPTPVPNRGGYSALPNNPYAPLIQEVFGPNASDFEAIMGWNHADGRLGGGENRGFDPRATNINRDGSRDIGLFQINENTYSDFLRRKAQLINELGIQSYEDLYDPRLNALMAKIIFDEQGYNAWYGAPPQLRSNY